MGLLDRIGLVIRSNLNDMVSKAEDPEKILEQTMIDMQEDLVQLRQAVASAIASQRRTEQQWKQAQVEADNWQQRAQLAVSKGDDNLAREALMRKKTHADNAGVLKAQLDQQVAQVEMLRKNLLGLESKIAEAKTKKDMLKARISAAKASEQIANMTGKINTSSAASAFDRMEEKVLLAEARSQGLIEASGDSLENQFAALESGSDVDGELAAMKAQLLGPAPATGAPQIAAATQPVPTTPVDAELEDLRSKLDSL